MINNTTNTSSKLAQTIDNIEHSSVLDELKSIARWMPYRLSSDEENTGSPKVKAISSEDGNFINPDDASLWRTFEEATEAEAKFNADGIGFVFGDRYTCITLDTTFDDGHDGIIPEIAQLERFFGIENLTLYAKLKSASKTLNSLALVQTDSLDTSGAIISLLSQGFLTVLLLLSLNVLVKSLIFMKF